jgi:quercetin dioxygenase-like cupin family protein
MTQAVPTAPRIVDESATVWTDHSRFPGVRMKELLSSRDNAQASVSRVQVPPGGVVGWHDHPGQVETVYVLQGKSILTLGAEPLSFGAGEIVAIPTGLEHSLRNEWTETVELLCFFTPPAG